jgi:hypothetical protein
MPVDVVDEHAQWMAENSSTPTMDSHVLAMDSPLRCSYTPLPPTSPRVTVEHPMKRDQNQQADDIGMVETGLTVERAWRLSLP